MAVEEPSAALIHATTNANGYVGAAGAALSVSFGGGVPGQSVYVSLLEIIKFNSATITGSGTPILIPVSNVDSLSLMMGNADGGTAKGTTARILYVPSVPIKATTPGMAVSVVCPATSGVTWGVTALFQLSL